MRLYEFRRNYKTPGQIEIQDLLKRVSTVRIRPGAPEICRARYHHGAGLFWSKGRIRAVDARVTSFPSGGGVFESARGHQRLIEPGTFMVPGSSGLKSRSSMGGNPASKEKRPLAEGASGRF